MNIRMKADEGMSPHPPPFRTNIKRKELQKLHFAID